VLVKLASCEERIQMATSTGLANRPYTDSTKNWIWCALVQPAVDLNAWLQMLAFGEHPAWRWDPNASSFAVFDRRPAGPLPTDRPTEPDRTR
jgi:hypothetical protein